MFRASEGTAQGEIEACCKDFSRRSCVRALPYVLTVSVYRLEGTSTGSLVVADSVGSPVLYVSQSYHAARSSHCPKERLGAAEQTEGQHDRALATGDQFNLAK